MNRPQFVRGLAAAPAALAAARASDAYGQALPAVRVMMAEGDDATPTLYAAQSGLFRKYGLDVQIEAAPSGAAALAALAGGAADVVGSSMLPILSAHQRNVPLQIIAPLAVSTPAGQYAALLVKKDSTYRTGRDFTGTTIASPALRDLNWVATMAWIDANGGNSANVQSIELPPSAIPAALAAGRVSASTVTTPRYVQAIKAGDVRSLGDSYDAISPRFLFAAIVTTAGFAQAHPDVVLNYGRAIRDASRYANTHHADTIALYASFAKLEVADITAAPRAQSADYVDPKDLLPMIDVAVRYKVLDAPLDPRSLLAPGILKPGA
jgi:NitT/TauT family transport system substrate-binding protein